jgi:hypothetical protein
MKLVPLILTPYIRSHYDAYRVFVDKGNQVVMEEPLFSTYKAADDRRTDIIKNHKAELIKLNKTQEDHSGPEFNGLPKHYSNGCGWEFSLGTY